MEEGKRGWAYTAEIENVLHGLGDWCFEELRALHYFEDVVHHVKAIDFSLTLNLVLNVHIGYWALPRHLVECILRRVS